jgi:hypothetical protein
MRSMMFRVKMDNTIKASYCMNLKLKLGMVKCIFPYTHASKTQEFNHKINVIIVNVKATWG